MSWAIVAEQAWLWKIYHMAKDYPLIRIKNVLNEFFIVKTVILRIHSTHYCSNLAMYLQVMIFSYSEHSAKKLLTLCGCDPKAGSGVLRSFCPFANKES